MVDKSILMADIPPESLKTRDGAGGKRVDYVEYGDIARILIAATDNEYSWEVISTQIFSDKGGTLHWMVHGRMTLPGIGSRDGIGTQVAQDGEAPKAAETDAFKRAARNFGPGLSLYDRDKAYKAGLVPVGAGQQQQAPSPQASVVQAAQRTAVVTQPQAHGRPDATPNGVWPGPGQCPQCHAPEGKRHGRQCLG